MLKTFSNNTCAFDAEWVPCPDTARRLLNLPPDTSDRAAMEAIWAHYAAKDADRGGREPKEGDRPFLKLVLSKVVSIAAVDRTVDQRGTIHLHLRSLSIADMDEGRMIRRFLEDVARKPYQLWGFSSAAADVPILRQRAIALGVPCPTFNKRPDKPWEGMDYHNTRGSEAHVDILDLVGGFNSAARPSLHEFAVACGIPGKLDVAGADVAEMYLEGRLQEIVEYNETDAVTTHLLMLRIGLHTGQLAPAEHEREIAAVVRMVEEQVAAGKGQFVRFAEVWGRAAKITN